MLELIYSGRARRISWSSDASGRYRGKEYYDRLQVRDQAKFFALFEHLGDHGTLRNEEKFRYEADGIFVLKISGHRLFSFMHGMEVLITHGAKKQRRRLDRKQLDRAARIRKGYLDSVQRGGGQQ